MSRKLAALLFALVVLNGAFGLKMLVAAHSHGTITIANGGAPPPMRDPK